MLSEKSLSVLMSCTSCYLSEVLEAHAGTIALTGGNPRAAKREIENALDDAQNTLQALKAHRESQAAKKTDPPAAPASPVTNREKIAAAIEEQAAAGVPNA